MPVLKFKLKPEFRSRAERAIKWLPGAAAGLPARMRVAPGKAILGAFAGWSAVILVGGVLMSHVSRENCCAVGATAAAVVEAPKAAVAVVAPKPAVAVAAPKPALAVAARKPEAVPVV